ncbi:FHA domain-containing protein [Actinocrispum wychmicini]|uniref:FHA domain-containing protein n=1 Tax=Actinocrispum wychmicini TaxID=1213861 RepID=A0A4R2J2J7_9PSEU|nr:FHA domain-containing protein [Actinocrispum wychmicini]TCO52581.1 FHA domain-containing protein [Actinocrispum wychmicini]
MPTCAQGHDSADDEFCDVCGLAFDKPTPAPATVAIPEQTGARTCPACGAPLADRFCEDCGADSLAPPPPKPVAVTEPIVVAEPAAEPVAVSEPSPDVAEQPATPAVRTQAWSVVVSADRKYYESVKSDGGPDADTIVFPPYCPDRHFPLRGDQVSIGRRSVTRGILPDIDLTGPPEDPGVSRLHALLVSHADGGWAIVDINSANGTTLNYRKDPLRPNTPRPLADGDRVHVGAWTTITIQAD